MKCETVNPDSPYSTQIVAWHLCHSEQVIFISNLCLLFGDRCTAAHSFWTCYTWWVFIIQTVVKNQHYVIHWKWNFNQTKLLQFLLIEILWWINFINVSEVKWYWDMCCIFCANCPQLWWSKFVAETAAECNKRLFLSSGVDFLDDAFNEINKLCCYTDISNQSKLLSFAPLCWK